MAKHHDFADDLTTSIEALEREIFVATGDAKIHFQIGVLLLGRYFRTGKAQLLWRAGVELNRAIAIQPEHARSHAMLGYANGLMDNGEERALACFREAHRLEPRNEIYEVYVLNLLQITGREDEALAGIKAAAPRHGVNLQSLRHELKKYQMPTDASTLILNGFINARNYFESSFHDEIESIINFLNRDRKRAVTKSENELCVKDQRELKRSFDASGVPKSARMLAERASTYGVGDDVCRPYLLSRLPRNKRVELIREVDKHAAAIHEWLDSFSSTLLPLEASAFMYLLVGVEEIRDQSSVRLACCLTHHLANH